MSGVGMGAAIIIVATLGLSLAALFVSPRLLDQHVFRPYWVQRGHRLYTLVTSGLVHADLPHLIFNGVTFWFFAVPLERTIGTARFLVLYLLGLLLSLLGTWIKHRDNPDYATLGASGAINAALFASIVYHPQASLLILPIPFPIPAPLFAVCYLAYSWWSSRHSHGRINHDAHIGGALTGLAFVLITDPTAFRRALALLVG